MMMMMMMIMIFLMLKLPRIWPMGEPPAGFHVLLTCLKSQLIQAGLSFACGSPEINHFSKQPWLLSGQVVFRNQG